jgi:hypothetical protein
MPAKLYLVTRPLVANRPGQEGAAKILRCGASSVFEGARRTSENRTLLLADAVEREGRPGRRKHLVRYADRLMLRCILGNIWPCRRRA